MKKKRQQEKRKKNKAIRSKSEKKECYLKKFNSSFNININILYRFFSVKYNMEFIPFIFASRSKVIKFFFKLDSSGKILYKKAEKQKKKEKNIFFNINSRY